MLHRAPLSLLYLNVLVVATCGLIYELLAGTLASYLMGDSVTQFSLVIGVYLSALGGGAWLSGYVHQRLARVFIEVELALALIGGFATPVLFLTYSRVDSFAGWLFGSVAVIGVLVGLELPLLMRILREHLDFRDLVSRVLAFDYLGALAASLLFPIFLVPRLGLNRTALVFGLLNAAIGLWGTYLMRPLLPRRGLAALRGRACLVIGLLLIGVIKADALTTMGEENTLGGRIVYSDTSRFQRIVVTAAADHFQLYLNGHLQFNSADEYRYHEALVHPAMTAAARRQRVLILGGGDALAAREVLRYDDVVNVTLVDLDPAMTRLVRTFDPLRRLGDDALSDPRLRVIHRDAFVWIDQGRSKYDVVIVDFPDPGTYSIGKLYTTRFFAMLRQRLATGATISIQCTSPLVAPESYGCVLRSLQAAGLDVRPYHAPVPTFGVWGFALAAQRVEDVRVEEAQVEGVRVDQRHGGGDRRDNAAPAIAHIGGLRAGLGDLRYLTDATMASLFVLPADLKPRVMPPNRLNDQILVRLYEREWGGHTAANWLAGS